MAERGRVMHRLRGLRVWPIKAKMLCVMLLFILFGFGVVIRSYFLERRNALDIAEHGSLLLVRSLAAQQKEIEITTRELLGKLAQSLEVQTQDCEGCNVLLRKSNSRYPYYSILGAITPDGNLFASSQNFEPGTVNLSDKKHVRDAISSHDFSAGEYSVGRVTGVQTIHYAYPAIDAQNKLTAILDAGFKLDMYAGVVARANLPADSVVVITDHRGVRVYRSPQSSTALLGQSIPDQAFERMSAGPDEGVFEGIAGDGQYRINAFKRLCLNEKSPPYLYMNVGIVKDKLLRGPNFSFSSSLLIIVVAAFAALGVAWVYLISRTRSMND